MGGRNLDARTHFYYFATVNTPAMAMKLIARLNLVRPETAERTDQGNS